MFIMLDPVWYWSKRLHLRVGGARAGTVRDVSVSLMSTIRNDSLLRAVGDDINAIPVEEAVSLAPRSSLAANVPPS
jgi:hypothetical protein